MGEGEEGLSPGSVGEESFKGDVAFGPTTKELELRGGEGGAREMGVLHARSPDDQDHICRWVASRERSAGPNSFCRAGDRCVPKLDCAQGPFAQAIKSTMGFDVSRLCHHLLKIFFIYEYLFHIRPFSKMDSEFSRVVFIWNSLPFHRGISPRYNF